MRPSKFVAISALLLCNAASRGMAVNGSVFDCAGSRPYHPNGVDICVDATKCPELISILKTVSAAAGPNPNDNVQRFFASYDGLAKIVKSSKRLVSAKSNKAGAFSVHLAAAPANLVVLAFAESTDGPPLYAFRELNSATRDSVSLVLDFTRGRCAP